jgi:hypothetical protein
MRRRLRSWGLFNSSGLPGDVISSGRQCKAKATAGIRPFGLVDCPALVKPRQFDGELTPPGA